jgi:hypothetical protein
MSEPPVPSPEPPVPSRDRSSEVSHAASAPPALRASDADRERVIDALRQAAGEGRLDVDELDQRVHLAYTMRTVAELESLTADVTVPSATTPSPAGQGVTVRPGGGGTSTIVSIMSGQERKGRWRIAPRCRVIDIIGGSDLDLTQAELAAPETTLTVLAIIGGSDVRVPEDVHVEISKFALMGGTDVQLSDKPVPPGAPTIRIRLISIMGGTSVKSGPKKTRAERRRERELRKAEGGPELGP